MPRADTCLSVATLREDRCIVHVRGGGILGRPFVDNALQARDVVEIHVRRRHSHVEIVLVAEDFQFAGLREDDEFMRQVSADRP